MIDSLEKEVGGRENLIIMAAFLQGVNGKRGGTANCSRVLGQALYWGSFLDNKLDNDARKEIEEVIEDWYGTLISMIKHTPASESLLEGFGNFGTEKDPPSHYLYTGCRLTPLGREYAQRLFDEHPKFKGAKGKLQRKARKENG